MSSPEQSAGETVMNQAAMTPDFLEIMVQIRMKVSLKMFDRFYARKVQGALGVLQSGW